MATYLDDLTDNQLEALETVLGELESGKAGTTSIRDIIDEAPILGKETVLYRYYKTSSFKGNSSVNGFYWFDSKDYIVASSKELPTKSGATVLAFKLPANAKAIPIGDNGYILNRGTVYYLPDSDATWDATVKELVLTASGRPAPSIFFSGGPMPERCEECGMSPIEQFYNRCHSGQSGKFCGGGRNRGGGGQQNQGGGQRQGQRPGGGGKPKVTKTEEHLNRVRNVVGAVAAVIGVIAVVSGAINGFENVQERSPGRRSTQRSQQKSVRRQVKREGLLERERGIAKGKLDRQDSAVMDWLTS